jgi:hypothetical protein
MYSYVVYFTCRRNGSPDTGLKPVQNPEPIPSLAYAKENGLDGVIERLLREEGHDITDLALTDIQAA